MWQFVTQHRKITAQDKYEFAYRKPDYIASTPPHYSSQQSRHCFRKIDLFTALDWMCLSTTLCESTWFNGNIIGFGVDNIYLTS